MQLVLPGPARLLPFMEDLETEDVVLELAAELLPRHPLPGLLALRLDHEHAMVLGMVVPGMVLAVVAPLLDDEVGADPPLAASLNREVLRTDPVTEPPQDVGVPIKNQGYGSFGLVLP